MAITLDGTTGISASGNVTGANIVTTGAISASGNITAAFIFGNASTVTGLSASKIFNGTTEANVGTSGGNANITVGGTSNVAVFATTGVFITGVSSASGNVTGGNIVTGGLITATGNITGSYILGNGSQLTGIDATSIQNGTSNVKVVSSGGNTTVSIGGTSNVAVFATTGVFITGVSSASGNVTGGNIVTGGLVSATGNVSGGNLNVTGNIVDTGPMSLVTAASGNINLAPNGTNVLIATTTGANIAGTLNATGNANVGNLGATNIVGTLTTASQTNITSVGTLGSLSVTGNVTGGNLVTAGVLNVTGTGVSTIGGNLDMTSNTIINLATPVNSTDAATKQYVDDVAQGLHTHDSCNAATQTTLATISSGTVTYNNGTSGVGATLTTTGTYTTIDGVTLADGMRILVKNEANTAHNGIYDRTSTTVLTRSTDFDTPTEMAGGDFTFVTAGTLYDNTGWVMPDPVTTVGTSAVVWVQFSGAGTYTAGTGLTLTGSQFSVNASQTQITSVGTLGSLSVTGNITSGNLSGTSIVGTLTTAAQTNITSVGTLSSLSVSGNVTAGNVIATLNGSGANVSSISATNISSGTLAQARLANASVTLGSTALTLGSTVTTVAGLTSVTSTTFVGALTGAATTAGTVTTAAQGNITSVGTLTALTVSGTITVNSANGVTAIVNGGTSGVGNIGASGATFNTVFAKATTAQYADLAENYSADAEYAPGTVLIFGGNSEVTVSNTDMNKRVVGVVSTNPAYLMNSHMEAEHVVSVALTGRAPCRVVGTVRKGDMMVATLNGCARAEENPVLGSVIGKAVQDFDGAEGVIEILVGRV
jgi:hypothetical protein